MAKFIEIHINDRFREGERSTMLINVDCITAVELRKNGGCIIETGDRAVTPAEGYEAIARMIGAATGGIAMGR